MNLLKIIAAITLCCFCCISAAHHSTAANFTREIISVSGTVKQVRFLNPHSSILVETENDADQTVYWLVESDAKSTYMGRDVDLDAIEIGSQIEVSGRKGLRPFTMYLREVVFEDGTRFTSNGVDTE